MSDIYSGVLGLDPVLRHPTRFAIVTLLLVAGPQTEGDVARKLNLAWGPLSTHVSRLVKAGYVERRRYPTLKGPRTFLILTEKGEEAYRRYVESLENLLGEIRKKVAGTGGGGRKE